MEGATYYQPVIVSGERRALRVVRVTPGQENEPPLQEQGMGHLEDDPVYLPYPLINAVLRNCKLGKAGRVQPRISTKLSTYREDLFDVYILI